MQSRRVDRPGTHRGWRPPWLQVLACLVILAGAGIALYPQIASWFSQREQSRVTELAQEVLNQPPNDNEMFRAEQIERAHRYNDALASGAIYRANENVAVGDGTSTDDSLVYRELLSVNDAGFMGRLRYDALEIDLPIYHGTDEVTLERGIGHLEGTSLPVGGDGTRSVLTAHRGLPTANLFNDLDKAQIGDRFTVSVIGEVLTYEVIETKVIEPEDTEAIFADPERDLVTLITCTPLGMNTHRILVTAERVTPTPSGDVEKAAERPDLPGFPWWAVALGGMLLALGFYVWWTGRDAAAPRAPHPDEAAPETSIGPSERVP